MSSHTSPYKGHKRQKSSISTSAFQSHFQIPNSPPLQHQTIHNLQQGYPVPQSAPASYHQDSQSFNFIGFQNHQQHIAPPLQSSSSYSRSSIDYALPPSTKASSSSDNNQHITSPLKRSASQQDIYYFDSKPPPPPIFQQPPPPSSSSSSNYCQPNIAPLFNYPPPFSHPGPSIGGGELNHSFKFGGDSNANVAGQHSHKLPTSSVRHQKNQLSISSHLTLFNLCEKQQQIPLHQPENEILQDLKSKLSTVDGSNINSYLLQVILKANSPYLLDDFYNLLYNERILPRSDFKLDKTNINTSPGITTIFESILNHFKNLDSLNLKINYHELLRNFLAIKILKDVLVQLNLNEIDEPQNYSIPRLSIYKVYYIICQKLICIYPSSTNSIPEQQKLILGQSKLGKLIKLVYPNLLIKRLGSRGESKYHYLGVLWNENIINDDIRSLCDNHELNDLNEIFNNDSNANPFLITLPKKSRKGSTIKIKKEEQEEKGQQQPEVIIESPNLSFIKPFLNYPPASCKFTILDEVNWFTKTLDSIYKSIPQIKKKFISESLFNNDNLLIPNNLLTNLVIVIKKLSDEQSILKLYLIVLLELLPFLLLIKTSSTNINFLKNLRTNLLYVINQLNNEIGSLNFNLTNSTIFIICIKKLINLNDLIITFIKLIRKDNNKISMIEDIESFLKDSKPIIKIEHEEDDENLNKPPTSLFDFNFKHNILSNDLVYTLVGFNFDPSSTANKQQIKDSLSMKFINQEINILDNFFKIDLKNFLNQTGGNSNSDNYSESILSSFELFKISSLFELIDDKLLNQQFKSKYPITIFNNFITFTFNDILKFIFLKKQENNLENQEGGSNNDGCFGSWWVFNCFVQEYLAVIGEIVGLNDCIQSS
ncbi:unnamed protein product [Candida verbasci]|uniref:RFX-type winged-helix domain-containing protein n=1 Tax=Candida verbasci TaxID=1227364 RepID=A0A9W4TZZ5_9ASCO|nr:unnamed protein product [Candida verbasci]